MRAEHADNEHDDANLFLKASSQVRGRLSLRLSARFDNVCSTSIIEVTPYQWDSLQNSLLRVSTPSLPSDTHDTARCVHAYAGETYSFRGNPIEAPI